MQHSGNTAQPSNKKDKLAMTILHSQAYELQFVATGFDSVSNKHSAQNQHLGMRTIPLLYEGQSQNFCTKCQQGQGA